MLPRFIIQSTHVRFCHVTTPHQRVRSAHIFMKIWVSLKLFEPSHRVFLGNRTHPPCFLWLKTTSLGFEFSLKFYFPVWTNSKGYSWILIFRDSAQTLYKKFVFTEISSVVFHLFKSINQPCQHLTPWESKYASFDATSKCGI